MVFHTQADDSDKSVHKENIKQFLLMVENGVTKLLARQSAPLVTAGVEEIRSIYAEANGYGNLMEPGIEGNPDRMKNRDLQAAGWQIVEPVFTKAREDAIDFYNQVSGSDRASDDLHVVLKAAEQGRVQYLLADLQREKWGTYDSEHDLVELHPEEQPGDEDLVNRAVLHTLLHGGEVFALPSDEMPDGDYLAAVFRF